jgi:hypothetical protein
MSTGSPPGIRLANLRRNSVRFAKSGRYCINGMRNASVRIHRLIPRGLKKEWSYHLVQRSRGLAANSALLLPNMAIFRVLTSVHT